MTGRMSGFHVIPALLVTGALAAVFPGSPAFAQTRIVPPPNKYSLADDVKLGQEASAQVLKQMPMLSDGATDEYVAGIGQRLVAAIPPEFQHPEFHYTFRVVNQKEINAFALPGGPMYLNRGMIEASHDEGEIAGVMAHEMSHVMLRHGTAQQTKGQKFQIGAIAGQVLGAIVGGAAGSLISLGSNFGISTYFMKFSREYESQADINGARVMALAGYDPRDMANMFKTIAAEGGSGPQWLSDHPDPGNSSERINQEAALLHVQGHAGENPANFNSIQARLKGMSPALTAAQIAQAQKNGTIYNNTGNSGGNSSYSGAEIVDVAAPSGSLRTYQPSSALRISVPSNWQKVASTSNSITYAPAGAYFQGDKGGGTFTHGVEVGTSQGTGNLQRDTESLVRSLLQGNAQLQRSGPDKNDRVGGRSGITISLNNVSEVTGQPEYISLSTTQLRDGSLLYMIGVAPETQQDTYDAAFRRIRQNIQISDR